MKQIILIGGAPTVGKSTLAKELSARLGLPWISTDSIRTMLQAVITPEVQPKLHLPVEHTTAETFLTTFTAAEIVQMEIDQGTAIWPAILAFITEDDSWKDGFIIEGVSLLPHLIAQDCADNTQVQPVFLVDEDADRTRHIVYTRGLWNDAATYSDDVKEAEVEWALLFMAHIKAAATKHGLPVINVTKSAQDLERVLQVLGL